MHHAVLVHVVQGIADSQRDFHSVLNRQLLFFVQDRAQQPAFDPLHHHVELAALFAVECLHHARVIEQLPDLLLPLEAL